MLQVCVRESMFVFVYVCAVYQDSVLNALCHVVYSVSMSLSFFLKLYLCLYMCLLSAEICADWQLAIANAIETSIREPGPSVAGKNNILF